MTLIDISQFESPGVVKDIEPFRLPAGVWTDGNNVLFKDGKIEKAFGYSSYIDSPVISPRALFFCPRGDNGLWLYPGTESVYAFDIDKTLANITRALGAYTGGPNGLWTFAYLHGIGLISNGVDDVQQWVPSLATPLVALSNWPTNTSCRVIRQFRNHVIALDVTKNGATRYEELVKWSHPADPGTVPASWDETNPVYDAGEFSLSEAPGRVLDGAAMGNSAFYVYKEQGVYSMTYIGRPLIFGFNRIFPTIGILGTNCVAQVLDKHFVITKDDIILHNGVQAKSIVDRKNRKWLFDNFETGGVLFNHCFFWATRGEVWFMFATKGHGTPDMALIWNVSTESVTFRTLSQVRSTCYAQKVSLSSLDTWETESVLQWGSDATIWDDPSFINIEERVLFADGATDKIMQLDPSIYTDNGANVTSYIERDGMPFIDVDANGNAVAELESTKLFKEVWPRITGAAGDVVSIYVGVQLDASDAITWNSPVTYTIGTTQVIPANVSGRLLSIKIQSTGGTNWKFHGFAYEVERLGRF